MNLLTIIQDFDQKLQTYDSSPLPFRKFIENLLTEYNETIQSADLFSGIGRYSTDEETLKERINIIVRGVKKSLNHFLQTSEVDGKALNILKKSITDSNLFHFTTRGKIYSEGSSFYRLRKVENSAPILSREQLFHIGFGNRGRASSQRFSAPGFPCLYVSNSIYAAWKELNEEVYTQGVMIKNNRSIYLFDFTGCPFNPTDYDAQTMLKELSTYSMLFPLIASCILKVKNKDNSFKHEYIIPQLLLEYIRNSPSVEGIMYKSTKILSTTPTTKFINVVIPPKTNPLPDKGYCEKLKVIFSMTDVEKITFDPTNLLLSSRSSHVNAEIESVDIGGNLYDYNETLFAKLEEGLNGKTALECSGFIEA